MRLPFALAQIRSRQLQTQLAECQIKACAQVASAKQAAKAANEAVERERLKRKEERAFRQQAEEALAWEKTACMQEKQQLVNAFREQEHAWRSENLQTWEKARRLHTVEKEASSLRGRVAKGNHALAAARAKQRDERELRQAAEEGRQRAVHDGYAAMRAQQHEWQSNNHRAVEKAKCHTAAVELLESERRAAAKRKTAYTGALASQKARRREAEEKAAEAENARLRDAARLRCGVRTNNACMQAKLAEAMAQSGQLRVELEEATARQDVQATLALEAQLQAAQKRVAALGSANRTLQQRVTEDGRVALETQLRAKEQENQKLRSEVASYECHLRELQEAEEVAEAADKAKLALMHKTHRQSMRRSKTKSKQITTVKLENRLKDKEIQALKRELAARMATAVRERLTADSRYEALLTRIQCGDARNVQVLDELKRTCDAAKREALESAEAQRFVEQQLANSQAELHTFTNFQATEGGRYKDSVRLCYYALINRKIPTNQIEGTIRDVLQMVGVEVGNLPTRSSAQNMRREAGFIGDVVAGVELAAARYVCGASDDTTKRQRILAADLTHHINAHGQRRTLCIGLSAISAATTKDKTKRYVSKMEQVRAAAQLSAPNFYGDDGRLVKAEVSLRSDGRVTLTLTPKVVAGFDRVTVEQLLTCWMSDRAAVERNMAASLEKVKKEQARAREGARQYNALRAQPDGASVRATIQSQADGGVQLNLTTMKNIDLVAELQRIARTDVAERMDLSTLPERTRETLMHDECVRVLGAAWWKTLSKSEKGRIVRVHALTCNAHRMVNIGKGFDEGLAAAYSVIRDELRASGDAGVSSEEQLQATSTGKAGKGGAPFDQLIWEVTKLLCLSARKMNVAIGANLLGYQTIELKKDPAECFHLRLKVMIGERFLVTNTNALPCVAIMSHALPPEERLDAALEKMRIRKSASLRTHNKLEASVLERYKDRVTFDALRCKAVVGHYLLTPMYMSTYQVEHVLELNTYVAWLDTLLEKLIADIEPLLAGHVHALQYWEAPLQHEPLLEHALYTPPWGDESFRRLLVEGLKHMREWLARHSKELLPGGKLDLATMERELRNSTWIETEACPIDNLACERVLATDCYLTQHLGTRMRVHAREAMIKYGMNVVERQGRDYKGAATKLVTASWPEQHLHSAIARAMVKGRTIEETEIEEVGRLHTERLPQLQENERMFLASKERRDALVTKMALLRQEGKELRRKGAVKAAKLTSNMIKEQLAVRVFLGCPVTGNTVEVRRTGNKAELVQALENILAVEVAAREAKRGGADGYTTEDEVARLTQLGYTAAAKRATTRVHQEGQPPQPRAANRRRKPTKQHQGGEEASDDSSSSDESSAEEGDATDANTSDDELDDDVAAAFMQDASVYRVEKIVSMRTLRNGKREFLIKWHNYSSKENTWEPEENFFDQQMVKAFLERSAKKAEAQAAKAAANATERESAAQPTRARSKRASALAAAQEARRIGAAEENDDEMDDDTDDHDDPPLETETEHHSKKGAKKTNANKRKRKVGGAQTPSRSRVGKRKTIVEREPDSSDNEGAHDTPLRSHGN